MILIQNLTKRYVSKNHKTCTALNGINLALPDKGMIFVIGKSGSGKSTLLNMIGGLDSFNSGRIVSFGNDLSAFKNEDFYRYRASHVGFIFQDFHLLEELTVAENIRLSAEIANVSHEEIKQVLSRVDLSGYETRYPSELSGGEKQRVVIARALIKNPNVLLCDEPVGNLDNNTSAQIMELLHKISREKLVVIVSHDMPDAEKYGDRVIELQGGKIVADYSRRTDYQNELTVDKFGTLILPYNRNLTDTDIVRIKAHHRSQPIRNIRQNDSGYEPTKQIRSTETKIGLRHSAMKSGSILKLFGAFLNASKFRAISTALISSVMLVLLIIMQSFLTFDGNRAAEGIINNESGVVALHKSVYTAMDGEEYTNLANYITDKDISDISDLGGKDTKTHLLYSYCLPIDLTETSEPLETEIIYAPTYGYNDIYVNSMGGTLACDEEYLIRQFGVDGELRVLAGDINETKNGGGIIITDYIADAILKDSLSTYESILAYQFHLSGRSRGRVVAVIYTGYKEKYAEEIAIISENQKTNKQGIELLEMDAMTNLMRDVSTNLSIGYTLNEDFLTAVADYDYRGYVRGDGLMCTSLDGQSVRLSDIVFVPSSKCQPGQIILTSRMYSFLITNNIIVANPEATDLSSPLFSSFKLERYEYPERRGELIFELELTPANTIGGIRDNFAYISFEDYHKLIKCDIIPFAAYIRDHKDVSIIIEALEPRGYIWPAANSDVITFVTDSVEMFRDLFEMLEMITMALIAIFLVSYGISNVRANKYQIGVIKAMGCRSRDISKIFLLENLVITVVIGIASYFGSVFMVDEANTLVLNSFEAIVGEKFGRLTIIAFSNELVFTSFAMTVVLGLVATVIPLLALHCIKPIKIIKSKE